MSSSDNSYAFWEDFALGKPGRKSRTYASKVRAEKVRLTVLARGRCTHEADNLISYGAPGRKALVSHHERIRHAHLRELRAGSSPRRASNAGAQGLPRLLKNRITDETVELLPAIGEECGLRERLTRCSAVTRSTSLRRAALHPPARRSCIRRRGW